MYLLVLVALILCILFKILNVNTSPQKSLFYSANAKFIEQILQHAPTLCQPYVPTRLWGFSGHVQTIIQGVLSQIHCPFLNGKRYYFKHIDGTTVTYDLYPAAGQHVLNRDYTLAICPGIGNSSDSVYIRRVVQEAQLGGYRVAVLNHIGVLKNVPVTSPRIFSYGNTNDYEGMVQDLIRRFPGTLMLSVGFSMGGNLITKYLGEEGRVKPKNIIGGISICQGYDAARASKYMLDWEGFRRLYLFAMTENMKAILRRWQKQLFTEQIKREKCINEKDVWYSATLVDLDDSYTRKLYNFDSVEAFYRNSSSVHYFGGIKVPMIFLNAADDPIVPPPLTALARKESEKNEKFIFIEQKHGGHLGFYEGGLIYPNNVTWLDRVLIEMANGMTQVHSSDKNSFVDEIDLIQSSSSSDTDEDTDLSSILANTSPKSIRFIPLKEKKAIKLRHNVNRNFF
ncbi:abhydrolase domain-containing protein 2 [Lepeophtheirus salmonis]|nr:abhydrolase domain-containing protein 2-like [Lepeophtheirus salmonis]